MGLSNDYNSENNNNNNNTRNNNDSHNHELHNANNYNQHESTSPSDPIHQTDDLNTKQIEDYSSSSSHDSDPYTSSEKGSPSTSSTTDLPKPPSASPGGVPPLSPPPPPPPPTNSSPSSNRLLRLTRQSTGFVGNRLPARLLARIPKLSSSTATAATAVAPRSSADHTSDSGSDINDDGDQLNSSDNQDDDPPSTPSSAPPAPDRPTSTSLLNEGEPDPYGSPTEGDTSLGEGTGGNINQESTADITDTTDKRQHSERDAINHNNATLTNPGKDDRGNHGSSETEPNYPPVNESSHGNSNAPSSPSNAHPTPTSTSSTPQQPNQPGQGQHQTPPSARRTPSGRPTRRRRSAFVENRRTASWTGMLSPTRENEGPPYRHHHHHQEEEEDGTTLPGEHRVHQANIVNEQIRGKWVSGRLIITSYQLRFVPEDISTYDDVPQYTGSTVPLLMIHRIDKVGGRSTRQENTYLLEIHCKDLRMLRFSFLPARSERREVYERLRQLTAPERFDRHAFCFSNQEFASSYSASTPSFPPVSSSSSSRSSSSSSSWGGDASGVSHQPSTDPSGWRLYHPEREYKRQGVFDVRGARKQRGAVWRLTKVNQDFGMSATYPPVLCVPASMTDDELRNVAAFRSKGRIPVLSWLNARTGASLTRSSQPLSGLFRNSSKDDQKLMDAITECNGSVEKLLIIDLRPRANAEANRAMGMGYESASQYRRCELKFMNIDNIHTMRESFRKLTDLCLATGGSDPQWFSRLEATAWLEHIRTLLTTSRYIADCLEKEQTSVHVHCSDGWDRTSQVVGLASMMLDPYLRTMEGFAVMVEKDWLSFGHKFHTRCGHGSRSFFEDQRGPIFLQFMDAVYQITRQFPTSFEFNEHFLVFIMDQVYTCRFGTFVYDCWRERVQSRVMEKTPSVWTYVMRNRTTFTNPFYAGNLSPTIIYPNTDHSSLRFWSSYFLRYCRADEGCFAVSMVSRVLDARGMDLLREVAAMEDARRMEDARNEATVQTFQRELRSMWEAHEALQKENEMLRDRTAASTSEWQSRYEKDTNRLLELCQKQHAMLQEDSSDPSSTESDTETDMDGDDTAGRRNSLNTVTPRSNTLAANSPEETSLFPTQNNTQRIDNENKNLENEHNLPDIDEILNRITHIQSNDNDYRENNNNNNNNNANNNNNSRNNDDNSGDCEEQINNDKSKTKTKTNYNNETSEPWRIKAKALEQEMRYLLSQHPNLRAHYSEKS